ncbi:hypothetical protein D0T53_04590 [Dysgonomonas sp. 216]|uniref:translocation/assembly module TamB domain-containing protein n=1 Tax=Dysgonomonas sp. 216 TaxID=2302934 RepID=UPI0013D1D6A4|nr:translocation/assembly module TamB domain-containing protein [Dysgonomonas sp. 216]NDW18196.1 hypothetical protein [Dysgonomonas sp. 216]
MEEEKGIQKPEKRSEKRYYKTILKVLSFIVLGVIGLFFLLYILLLIPPVQHKVIDFAISQLKPIVNTEVSVDKARLKLFNTVSLQGVYIEDQRKDTLAYIGSLDVNINVLKLLGNKLQINSIDLDNAVVNVYQDSVNAPFSFQFLIDAFASSDTTAQDSDNPMKISIENIELKNVRLNYDILSEPETPHVFNSSHISVRDFNTQLSLSSIDPLNLDVTIKFLSLAEKSGAKIDNLEGVVLSKNGMFWSKKFTLTLPESTLDITNFEFNIFKQSFQADINSEISKNDVVYFVPNLKYLRNKLELKSSVSGKLPAISLDNLEMKYGEETSVQLKASIADYSNYGENQMSLDIDKFKITSVAITDFARIGDSTFVAPEALDAAQDVRLKGNLNGKLSRMNIDAEAWTNIGSVQLAATASTDTTFEDIKGEAHIQTHNFNLEPIVGTEAGLKQLSMHSNIILLSSKNLGVKVQGVIENLQYKQDELRNIRFNAEYSPSKTGGWVNANLPMGKIDGKAWMIQGRNKDIEFDINIRDLLVDYFYNNPMWENPKLNVSLKGNFKGADISHLSGTALVDSLWLRGDNLNFVPGQFRLQSGNNDTGKRFINLSSSFLDASILGDYYLEELPAELTNIMSTYLPSFFAENKRLKKYKNKFDIAVTIKNTENLSKIFDLPATIITPATITSTVNTVDKRINLSADIPLIRFNNMEVQNTRIGLYNTDTNLGFDASLRLPQDTSAMDLALDIDVKSDTIKTLMSAVNKGSEVSLDGKFNAHAHFREEGNELVSYLKILPTNVNVGKFPLAILPAEIENKGNRTQISGVGLALNNKKYFAIDGVVSDNKEDTVGIYFDHSQIGDILTAFNINNISAELNGEVFLTNVLGPPELYTKDLALADMIIFGDTLGTLNLESNWNNTQQAINFDAQLVNKLSNSRINGHVCTVKDSINMNVDIDRFSLNWIEPFMAGVLNDLSGSISSKMNINGSIAAPKASGWLGFNDTHIGIDYTNVNYHISDTIAVNPTQIGFDNLTLFDENNNKATVQAVISHNNFKDINYTLNMKIKNLLLLNTPNRTDSLFYGRLSASGDVEVKGNADNIDVKLKNITNGRNSKMNIVIPQVSSASTYQSIVYINTPAEDSSAIITMPAKMETSLPLKLDMDVKVTPGLSLSVLLDPITGDALQMEGRGQINFSYDLQADKMQAFGDYIIEEGTVKLRLQNIKTLNFNIREGSKVTMAGDPMRSTFNITAYQRVRASLNTLDPSFENNRIYVDCELGIRGNMQKMELTYNVTLPDSNDDIRQKVNSIINTDQERIKQFAYLLATGSFYPTNNSGGNGNMVTGLWTSVASGALSKGLDSLLGGILGRQFQVGTEISSEDGSFSNVDMRVNVSTRLFDDKLKLNTNLGYRTDQTTTDENQFVGDFDVEYELTRTVQLKAFNRTNDRIYKQAETTQGIGIVYTKEAKKLKDLFRSTKRKRNKDQTKQKD